MPKTGIKTKAEAPEGKKKASAVEIGLVALFVGFIAVFFLLILVLPKHEGELSPNERRTLAAAPDASLDNILSGGFSKQADTWMQDHFPARSFFVSVYAYLNRFTGRNPVEDISLGKNERLFTAPVQGSDAAIEANIEKLNTFVEANGLKAYSFIIPTAGYMLGDELPAIHREYRDGELIARLNDGVAANISAISAEEALRSAGDVASLYYRTDHHLTMRGSYVSYCAVARALGLEPLAESEFTKTSYDFYGTSYGKSGLFLTPPDTLETWVGDYDASLAVTTVDGSREEAHTGSLDMSCLEEGVVDRYACYLYSNHGITYIENPDLPRTSRLLVLKDSYGNAIVPFLAAHYHTIVMIDVRQLYYGPGMPTPSELCSRLGIRNFVVLTGLDTVADGTLDWLR